MANLIYDKIITVASTQEDIDLTSTPIEKGTLYKCVMSYYNGTGSTVSIGVFANDNTTLTNYYRQSLQANSTTVSGARVNESKSSTAGASNEAKFECYIKLTNDGKLVVLSSSMRAVGSSSLFLQNFFTTSTVTFTNITKLSIISTITNGIGSGRIQLYKVAEKVQDIEITSATTQQDITVDIGKGNEYLLVSDLVNGATTSIDLRLYVNDDVTSTNYTFQYLRASSTSLFSGRFDGTDINVATLNEKGLGITKLKLPNSGYFQSQSEVAKNYGGSGIELYKFANTHEVVQASITKLNLIATQANGLGIGSRFELYKLT